MDVNTSAVNIGDGIGRALKSHLQPSTWQWLSAQVARIAVDPTPGLVARTFTSLPRELRTDQKAPLVSVNEPLECPHGLSLTVQGWTAVRLARVWVLSCIPELDEPGYVQLIERLFKYGDMEELAALYSALPVYHYPQAWLPRCKEGIRSNIGHVRHAVIVNNAYPAHYLDEDAWNQLVLKAFFTEEDIPHIIGLKRRNNTRLAEALTDYAYERYAAQRQINPMLWILVGPFMDNRAFELMQRIMDESALAVEQQAIAYAFAHSDHGAAQRYLRDREINASFSEPRGTPWEIWSMDTEDTKNKHTDQ